jgi:hypothetical protein
MDNPAAVMGTTHNGRSLEDGSIELTIVISPDEALKVTSFGMMNHGANIGMVLLNYKPAKWGKQSQQLRLSSFFRTPKVWQAIGSDQHYQDWCRSQPSAYSRRKGTESDPMQYAHVRRVADGSGTGIKPSHSGIPLLASEHARQHHHGESVLGGKAWADKQRITHVVHWAWETLKGRLGYEHWPQVPPEKLLDWAKRNDVDQYLPQCYRG